MKKVLLFLCALVAAQMANAWYLVGIGGDWSTFHEPTKTEGSNQYWENVQLGASEQFKITSQPNWDGENLGNYGYNDGWMSGGPLTEGDNATWNGTAGTYTLMFNTGDKSLTITKVADAVTETLTYNVTVPAGTPTCYIAGEMNGWSFTEMTKVNDTQYTITYDNVLKSTQYKYTWGADWAYEENLNGNRTWSENDVVSAWKISPTEPTETLTYTVTVPAGTVVCYIAGAMNGWSFTEMTKVDDTHFTITYDDVTKSAEYKYACGTDWAYEELKNGQSVSNRTWSENDVVEAWRAIAPVSDITYGVYCLDLGEIDWKADGAWFSAYFYNSSDAQIFTWVRGVVDENRVYFGLEDQENTYTHVVFARFNPAAAEESWDDTEDDSDAKDLWNKTNDIAYKKPANGTAVYKLIDMNTVVLTDEFVVPTGVNRVELADGIGYAYGVVSAEGAIEVYNVNGAVVARGNDNVDLRGLGRGVYIIRNGNQVRKVVR